VLLAVAVRPMMAPVATAVTKSNIDTWAMVRLVPSRRPASAVAYSRTVAQLPPAGRTQLATALRQLVAAAGEGYGTVTRSPVPL
jgi:hypothetical protein